MPQERSRSIQYINKLRIFSIYAVVTAHVTIWLTMASTPFTFNWWLGTSIFYACFCSIPVFVMISGALLLDNSRDEPMLEFYRKRMVRVGVPLVSWTIVYLGVRGFLDHERLTAGRIFELILTADPYYHLWFFYMIAGSVPRDAAVADLRAALHSHGAAVRHRRDAGPGDRLLPGRHPALAEPAVGLHPVHPVHRILSARLRAQPDRPTQGPFSEVHRSGRSDLRGYLAAFARPFIARQGGVGPGERFVFDFFTPPIIFVSIAIFWIARRLDVTAKPANGIRKIAVEWIASTTLGVYALHPLVLKWIQNGLKNHTGDGGFLAGVLLVPLVTFAVCYLITSILMNIPILRRAVC